MPVAHTNRRGDLYLLHEGKTKAGKPKYQFSKKVDGNLASGIPAGYEIYENPRGQVFLRKELRSLIRDDEVAACREAVGRSSSLKPYHYMLDVRKDAIEVYTLDDDLSDLAAVLSPTRRINAEDFARRHGNYSAMLRFVLADAASRSFAAERFCFLGGIDDWIFIGGPAPLASLVKKFARHLGQESFFELI